jgi:hypothetical protein
MGWGSRRGRGALVFVAPPVGLDRVLPEALLLLPELRLAFFSRFGRAERVDLPELLFDFDELDDFEAFALLLPADDLARPFFAASTGVTATPPTQSARKHMIRNVFIVRSPEAGLGLWLSVL